MLHIPRYPLVLLNITLFLKREARTHISDVFHLEARNRGFD